MKTSKKDVLKRLRELGEQVYGSLSRGEFPRIEIPDRSTSNIRYDPSRREFVLGDKRVMRSSYISSHLRPFTQLIWMAFFANELVTSGKTSTLRDVFYSSQAFQVPFDDQHESDEVIMDLEAVLGIPREAFNIIPEERGSIFGDLTVEYTLPGYEGKRINLTSHPDGVMIGHALRTAEFVDTSAERVFVIEKGGVFTRFIEERVHERYKAILINTMGQAPRSARYLIRRLNEELGLPVYIFSVDGCETILIEEGGLIKTVRIGELVDELLSKSNLLEVGCGLTKYERCSVSGIKSIAIASDGSPVFADVLYVLRHEVKEPLYEVTVMGGYSVRVTGSHSVMVYRDGRFVAKPVSQLKRGDLLIMCFSVPNRTHLTGFSLSDLVLREAPQLAEKIGLIEAKYGLLRRSTLENSEADGESSRLNGGTPPDLGAKTRLWTGSGASSVITISSESCRLLGYYAARGVIPEGGDHIQLLFRECEEELVDDTAGCARTALGCSVSVHRTRDGYIVKLGDRILAELFREVLKTGSSEGDKEVPFLIFNVPNELKLDFLTGYFRSNGKVKVDESGMELSTFVSSRKLASDLILLLAQLDTLAMIRKGRKDFMADGVPNRTSAPGGEHYIVVVRLGDSSSPLLRNLAEDLCGLGRCRVSNRARDGSARSPLSEVFMGNGGRREDEFRANRQGADCDHDDRKGRANLISEGAFIRGTVLRKGFLENKVLILPVVKIERVPPTSKYVYDIEVAGLHTFVGGLGPFVLHNTDGDPWGLHIAMVIISGSANSAHIRGLTTPDAKWIGVWATDIERYKLPYDKMGDLDIKRLNELKRDPRYRGDLWQREIDKFLTIKKKSEQEAFARYGLTYIVDTYLKEKMEELTTL